MKVSETIKKVADTNNWKRSTSTTVLSIIRKVLTRTKVIQPIIKEFVLPAHVPTWNILLGKKYGRLHKNDPLRQKLKNWIEILKNTTKNQSSNSLRSLMFFLNTTIDFKI